MQDAAPNSVINIMAATGLMSLAALFFLFQKHISGSTLLNYEPRQRTPWGPLVALFALGIPLINIIAFFFSGDSPPTQELTAKEILTGSWTNFAFMVFFVPALMFWITSFFQASSKDLGLPTSWKQLRSDILLGLFATIAIFLPLYILQFTLLYAFQSETVHPIVEQLQKHQSTHMLIVGCLLAVVAAPLFEEFTFRLLFQGWLERKEDETIGYIATQRITTSSTPEQVAEIPSVYPVQPPAHHQSVFQIKPTQEATSEEVHPLQEHTQQPMPSQLPTAGWLSPLPHGWTPILISGTLFGLAHLGHGVAPIPLILFGVVLGYLYQRTHRLAPSIAAHATFNAYSMVLLWLQLDSLPPG